MTAETGPRAVPKQGHSCGSRSLWRGLLFVLCCWLGMVEICWARHAKSDGSDSVIQAELALFDAAMQKKDYAAAYQALVAAYRRHPGPRLVYLLAGVALAEGRTLQAQDLFRRFVAEPGPDSEAMIQEAQPIIDRPHGPAGEVNLRGERGALIFVDNRLVGELPLPLPLMLAVGDHTIVIELGRRKTTAPIKVQEGRGAEIRFSLDSNAAVVTQPPAVVILPEFTGLPFSAGPRLIQGVAQEVRRANLTVFDAAVAVGQVPAQKPCVDTVDCQIKLGQKTEVDYVLSLLIETRGQPGRPDLRFALKLLDVSVGALAAEVEKSCSSCTVEKAVSELRATAEALLGKALGRKRGNLSIRTMPLGATVRLHTTESVPPKILGQTPYNRSTWAGSMDVSVALSGYKTERLAVVVEEGAEATYTVKLQPEESRVKTLLGRPLWRWLVGGGLIVGGTLLMGFGGSALSYNAQCVDMPSLPKANCDSLYSTQVVGGTLVGVGIALGVSGIVMLVVPAPK